MCSYQSKERLVHGMQPMLQEKRAGKVTEEGKKEYEEHSERKKESKDEKAKG